jgi:hypothetical protein
MERVESVAWQIVGAVLVVLIFLAITIHTTVGWSEVGAAWVQAVGSVLALFLTGTVVIWEARQRRLEVSRVAAERLLARVAVIKFAAERIAVYAVFVGDKSRTTFDSAIKVELARVRYALKHAKRVEMSEMPTSVCVEALAKCRFVIDLLDENNLISDSVALIAEGGASRETTVRALKNSVVRLDEWITILKSEANRLAG